jgi:hypothetical protein
VSKTSPFNQSVRTARTIIAFITNSANNGCTEVQSDKVAKTRSTPGVNSYVENSGALQEECEAVKRVKQEARAAKARAEADVATARTHQEAQRAEAALKDAASALKEALRAKEPPPPSQSSPDSAVPFYFEVLLSCHPCSALVRAFWSVWARLLVQMYESRQTRVRPVGSYGPNRTNCCRGIN